MPGPTRAAEIGAESRLVVATTSSGEHRIWVPAPGIVATACMGHGSAELAGFIERDMTRVLEAEGGAHVFADWAKMTGYDSAARIQLTRWMKKIRPLMTGFSVLVRSRFVAMGVSVANLALGGNLQSFTSEQAFRRALDDATRAARPVE
jgi:hypothetical protein